MNKLKRSGHIGVLTSGGDTPGLNAAIRGIGKTAANDGCHAGHWIQGWIQGIDGKPLSKA